MYQRLLDYAALQLSPLLDHRPATPRGRFIVEAAGELATAVTRAARDGQRDDGPGYDLVDLLADSDPDDPDLPDRDLWRDLMCTWPLGAYAYAAADQLPADLTRLRVLEVGAGVGNLTRLIRPRLGAGYVRADLNPHLPERVDAPGRVVRWNFDEAWPHGNDRFDLVLAVNALHCAADPDATLRRLRALVAPGGRIVIAEGAPYTPSPWALTAPFGILDGWWNRGGFLPTYRWCGLGLTVAARLMDDGHHLGAVYTWEQPW